MLADTIAQPTESGQETPAVNERQFGECYLIVDDKGSPFRKMKAPQARRGDVTADLIPEGWAYERKEGAEAAAERLSTKNRKLSVRAWYSRYVDDMWYGTPQRAKLARKKVWQEINREKNSKELKEIKARCVERGLDDSWLYRDALPDDMSDRDKKTFNYYKPIWEKAKKEAEELEVSEHDIKDLEGALDEEAIPSYVVDLNKKHAVVHQGKTLILTEKYNPTLERGAFTLEPIASLHAWYENKQGEGGKPLSKLWISHPARREYPGGIVFDPRREGHFDEYYNLFQGWSVKPAPGDCSLCWELLEVLAGGDKRAAAYIRKWLAHMVQRPWELPETAIAFRGLQGTGKGTLMRYLAKVVGRYYFEPSQMGQVIGRFNSHLKDIILVYANEALWGGNRQEVGALKAMITDPMQAIEQKGIDIIQVRNCKRLILSSNEDWIVPMDLDDRRFLVCDVDPKYKEDKKFFCELAKQMDSGGVEALMADLMNENIEGWHPRDDLPGSAGAFGLKMKSMKPGHRWLYECLSKERYTVEYSIDTEDSPLRWREERLEKPKNTLYDDFEQFCKGRLGKKEAENAVIFWKQVREILGPLHERKLRANGNRLPVVEMPPLQEARDRFAKHSKEDPIALWEL